MNSRTKASSSSNSKPQPSSSRTSDTTSSLSYQGVLFLKNSHVTFDTPTQKVSVFFDECNREVISLTSGVGDTSKSCSKTKVVFQSIDCSDKIQFLLPVEKKILSIKLNYSRTVLAYHVEKSNIEFINIRTSMDSDSSTNYELEDRRYIQSSRSKNSKLFGFLWTGPMEIVMITDISVEYYHVEASKHRLKHIKSFSSPTNWFVYQPSKRRDCDRPDTCDEAKFYSILMVSVGSLGNAMQPYMFTRGQIVKLHRFEVEGNWHGSDKMELFERSITIAFIYGCVRLLVLQHESLNVKSKGAQILVYTVDADSGSTNKTHTLDLDVSGRFAINVLDNLVIAHDQPSKSSFIFDIMIESTEKSDCPKHFVSLIDRQPIRPLYLEEQKKFAEMYSLDWVFFQPNFIINAQMGLLTILHLDLSAVEKYIQDNLILMNFLSHRKNFETVILKKIKEIVVHSCQLVKDDSRCLSPLAEVSSVFEVLSRSVITAGELEKKLMTAKPTAGAQVESQDYSYRPSIFQEDFHREVVRKLDDAIDGSSALLQFSISVLLEFIFALRRRDKSVEFCIYEQLLKYLVKGQRFYQVVQMIRFNIFQDSKQLACLLLSLKDQYRPAAQLGLDMLHRLDCLNDQALSLCLNE